MPKKTADILLPEELRYTAEHIWVRADGDELVVGVSDYAQDQLGEVVFVDLPEADTVFAGGDVFGEVESVKSVNTLSMPVSGTVTAVNEELSDAPTLLNVSCYDKGWIIRIRPENPSDAGSLLDAAAYRKTLQA